MRDVDLSIALPKGRLLGPALQALTAAGLNCPDIGEFDRRLVFECDGHVGLTGAGVSGAGVPGAPLARTGTVRFIMARPADVAAYVEYGAADLGITGKDVLLEGDWNVYELLDLGFGTCRMVVAGPASRAAEPGTRANGNGNGGGGAHVLRVATKFPNIARSYVAARRDVCLQVIKLNGAVEIAPITGLADVIVDLVDTGRTLRENGLVVLEELFTVSARLIANRASVQLKSDLINAMTDALAVRNVREA